MAVGAPAGIVYRVRAVQIRYLPIEPLNGAVQSQTP